MHHCRESFPHLQCLRSHWPSGQGAFLSEPSRSDSAPETTVLVGGDFNCTVKPEHDRSNWQTAVSHYSPALNAWMGRLDAVDVLELAIEETDMRDIADF